MKHKVHEHFAKLKPKIVNCSNAKLWLSKQKDNS